MPGFQKICQINDVPKGSARMFIVGDMQIGIFHIEDELFALNNRCPHAGASLAHGTIDGDTVSCRIHHWRFCLRDGKRLDELDPESDVCCFPVRLVGEEIQVELG